MPWNVREGLIDVAAALVRYSLSSYGDDDLRYLNSSLVERAWKYECQWHGGSTAAQLSGMTSRTDFHKAASDLVRYAVGEGLLDAVAPDMVGIERLTILSPHNAPGLGPPEMVMMQDLDGTPLGMVNVYTLRQARHDRQA